MKNSNLNKSTIVCLMLIILSTHSFAQYKSLFFGGTQRTYMVHLPEGYQGKTSLPLIIAMHGGFGNAKNIESQSRLSVKADSENFIVVYPEAVKGGVLNISSWNAGWCCGFASSSDVDDVGFINELLDTLIRQYPVDTNRIYATGMSNGGFMCYRLACELSHRIAAIAPVAASMSMTSCNPIRPVPVIDFHSYMDTHIPYEGGVGNGASSHYNLPQDSVLNFWANTANCTNPRDTVIDTEEYTFIKITSCDCATEIHHYATRDGGHSWPGGVSTAVGDPVSAHINATDLMWSFFQQHTLKCESTDINKNVIRTDIFKVFPNPSTGIINIEMQETDLDFKIRISDQTGTEIANLNNSNVIKMDILSSGLYYITVQTERQIMTKKIIILN